MADAVGQQSFLQFSMAELLTDAFYTDPYAGDRGNYLFLPFFFCSTQPAYGAFHPHQLASFRESLSPSIYCQSTSTPSTNRQP